MSQYDAVCFLSSWVILFLCTEWGGCHQGGVRTPVQKFRYCTNGVMLPLLLYLPSLTCAHNQTRMMKSSYRYPNVNTIEYRINVLTFTLECNLKSHLNLTVAVTIHIFAVRHDSRAASTCINYSTVQGSPTRWGTGGVVSVD